MHGAATTIRTRRSESGAAALEFALLVPLILVLVFATISYAYMFSFRQALSQAAAEGARASVGASAGVVCPGTGPFTTGCPAQQSAAQAVAGSLSTYEMTCGTKHLTCTIAPTVAAGCATGHTCVSVTVTYPYRDYSLLPTMPGMGFTLPEQLSFTSVVVTG